MKDKVISFRVNSELKSIIEVSALQSNQSVSQYIQQMILFAFEKQKENDDDSEKE